MEKTPFHHLLAFPSFYQWVQTLLFRKDISNAFYQSVGSCQGLTVLDVGCGTGADAAYYDQANYYGIDLSSKNISYAQKHFSNLGQFFCVSIENLADLSLNLIDVVIMKGVLHHLSDEKIVDFFKQIKPCLSSNARFYSIDPVFVEKQHFISKFLVSLDRGFYVRTYGDYLHLLKTLDLQIIDHRCLFQALPPYDRMMMTIGFD